MQLSDQTMSSFSVNEDCKQASPSKQSFDLISILLPVHNQADHISRVVTEHCTRLKTLPVAFELILIPNGCSDQTESLCSELAQTLPGVRTITSKEAGWGQAIKVGIENANGDLLCYASSARISSQDLYEHVRIALRSPYTVVKSSRMSQDNWLRQLGSRSYNWFCRMLFNIETRDVNGTPKSFPKSFSKLLTISQNGYLVDVEFNLICAQNNYPIREFPIEATPRHGGTSSTSLFTAFKLFSDAFHYWFDLKTGRRHLI